MMRARPLVVLFLLLFLSIHRACAQSAPSISGLSQWLGAAGQSITISGSGFGAAQGSSVVAFGSATASISAWSDTSIIAAVPSSLAAGNANIVVTVNGTPSNSASFLVIPVITGLSTYSASPGSSVTISGSGFDATQGSSTITFNGIYSSASSWSNSSIVTSVPTGASTGPLTVTVNSIATNSVNFTVPTPAPTVSSVSPGVAPVGTAVTVTGANFGDTQGSSRVLFSGLHGSPTSSPTTWSATSITVPVPDGAITGRVSVIVNGRVSNSLRFVVANLNISSISPSAGGPGTVVTISGSGFGATQTTSLVTFNGAAAAASSWSDSQIVVTVPNGATTGNVVVTENNTPSNGVLFTTAPPPAISGLSPSSGGPGTIVTIFGSNFGPTQGGSQVLLSPVALPVVSWSDTSIQASVPDTVHSGNIVVVANGTPSNSLPFRFILAFRASSQSVYISPDEMTLTVGDLWPLTLVDQQGHEINDATWTIDDPTLASFTFPPDTPTDIPVTPSLEADAPGQATITAVSSSGSAKALVRIFAAGQIPAGTPLWSVYPDSSNNFFESITQGRPTDPGDPDAYILESLDSGGTSLRAVNENGSQLWRTFYDQGSISMVAMPDGAALLDDGQNLTKISGSGETKWTQPISAPAIFQNADTYAVAYDGTIYSSAGVFDGQTGALLYVPQLPSGTLTESGPDASCADFVPIPNPGGALKNPVVAANGRAYLVYQVQTQSWTADLSCKPLTLQRGHLEMTSTIAALELTPTGPGATVTLAVDTFSGPVEASPGHAGRSDFPWTFKAYDPNFDGPGFPGYYDVQIPETLVKSITPEGSGGVLIPIIKENHDLTEDSLLVRVANGGIQYNIGMPGGNASVDIAVTDDNVAVLTPQGGTQTLTAIDPLTGSALWSVAATPGCDTITTLSATDDDGVLTQDVNYCADVPTTTIAQLDTNGASMAGASASLAEDISLEFPQYFFSGGLIKQDQNTSAFENIFLPGITSNPGITYPVIGKGNASKTKAARGFKLREFVGTSPKKCTGYDDKYNALMVPQTPNSNTLEIKVHKGNSVFFTGPTDLTALTFQPLNIEGDGQFHQLSVSGGSSTVGTFQIQAHAADGTPLGSAFQADVKPLRTIDTVTLFSLVAPGLTPQNVPTPTSLAAELNRIFPRQANVVFTNVLPGGNFNFSYDLDHDSTLFYDVNSAGKGCFPESPIPNNGTPECRTSRSELGPVFDAFYAPGQHARGDARNYQVVFVNKFSNEDVGGYSMSGVPAEPAMLRTDFGTRSVAPNYRENITTHEIGHILGKGGRFTINGVSVLSMAHSNRGSDHLMWPRNVASAPCRISRDDWNVLNFTPGTKILGADKNAH